MQSYELTRDDFISMTWDDIKETLDWLQEKTGESDGFSAEMLRQIADGREG
tara:strand:- start:1271 stop:1423 length:153 start_codon:yes stop_codon:yes gene_type:complete